MNDPHVALHRQTTINFTKNCLVFFTRKIQQVALSEFQHECKLVLTFSYHRIIYYSQLNPVLCFNISLVNNYGVQHPHRKINSKSILLDQNMFTVNCCTSDVIFRQYVVMWRENLVQ